MRALKILCILMGVTIIAGVIILIAVLSKRMSHHKEPLNQFSSYLLPKEYILKKMFTKQDLLVLHLRKKGNYEELILLVNSRSGQIITQLATNKGVENFINEYYLNNK